MITKIRVHNKKGFCITGLEGADKSIEKKIRKDTSGSKGLLFLYNPYYIKDVNEVVITKKKNGFPKTIRVKMKDKLFKIKKKEWDFDPTSNIISFKGDRVNGYVSL